MGDTPIMPINQIYYNFIRSHVGLMKLPGFDNGDVDLELKKDFLMLKAEKKSEEVERSQNTCIENGPIAPVIERSPPQRGCAVERLRTR